MRRERFSLGPILLPSLPLVALSLTEGPVSPPDKNYNLLFPGFWKNVSFQGRNSESPSQTESTAQCLAPNTTPHSLIVLQSRKGQKKREKALLFPHGKHKHTVQNMLSRQIPRETFTLGDGLTNMQLCHMESLGTEESDLSERSTTAGKPLVRSELAAGSVHKAGLGTFWIVSLSECHEAGTENA